MILLGIDVETTGLDPSTDRITELGMVLYDTDANQPLKIYCEYVNIDGPVPEFITELTGITKTHLDIYGVSISEAMQAYVKMLGIADHQVAHNAPFDRSMIDAEIARLSMAGLPPETPWIDTSVDVPYPKGIQTRKLQYLCPEHGFINPWSHRALFDVLSMLKVLSQYDIKEVVRIAGEPNITVMAICQKPWEDKAPDGQKDTDLAKGRGYRFNGESKQWQKTLKQSQLSEELNNGQLKVQVLEG